MTLTRISFSLFLLNLSKAIAQYQRYGLKILSDPFDCVAGEVCSIQPMIAAIYSSSGEIAYSFQGNVFVNLVESPTGYDKLYIGSGCGIDSCGNEVVDSLATVSIVNGIGTFQVKLYLILYV